jgi:chromosome segregation ATPase
MLISEIHISNILGIKEMHINAGTVTDISGRNGAGKSSVLGAIRTALGAKDAKAARLVHDGADEGEVVLVLDDGMRITRTVKPDNTTSVKVVDANGNKYSKPQSVLDALFNTTQFNPVKLLMTDKDSRDKRQATIMECIPMVVTQEDLKTLAPELNAQLKLIDTSRHGLDVLDDIYKRIFDTRTDVNRDVKQLTASLETMKANLKDEDTAEDVADQLQKAQTTKDDLNSKKERYFREFEEQRRKDREAAIDSHNALVKEAAVTRDIAVQAANSAYEEAVAALNTTKETRLQTIEENVAKLKDEKQKGYDKVYQPVVAEIARLEERAKSQAMIDGQKKIIAQQQADADAKQAKANELTATLERILAHREKLLSTMPIKGLEVKEGDVFYGGLQFDQLNTAKRIELATEIAALRAGDLQVVCVDGVEALDADNQEMLAERMASRGLQLIRFRVDDSELTVSSN